MIPQYRQHLPRSSTGKFFSARLDVLFSILFADHELVGRNHHALQDAQQLRLMASLLIELQKRLAPRDISQFPISTQEYLTTGQASRTSLQNWLRSGITIAKVGTEPVKEASDETEGSTIDEETAIVTWEVDDDDESEIEDEDAEIWASAFDYIVCGHPTLGLATVGDSSVPSALGPLPGVIERTDNVIIGHGNLDFLLIANGSRDVVQNMAWNGKQGFQTAPSSSLNFYVPYHQSLGEILYEIEYQPIPSVPQTDVAGAGLHGFTHTERGLK